MSAHAGTTLQSSTVTVGGNLSFTNNVVHHSHPQASEPVADIHTVANWVSSISFHAIQKDTYEKVTPGTGTWILETKEFQDLLKIPGSTLWGTGIPGAGKTCLTSVVVNHLENWVAERPNTALVFVYCRFEDQLSVVQILRSLLRQFVEHSPPVFDHVTDILYKPCVKKNTTPSQSEIYQALQHATKRFSQVFIALDALDELHDDVRHEIVELLVALKQSLFLTSRPTSLPLPAASLNLRAPTADFDTFIRRELHRLPKLKSLLINKDIMTEITEKIKKTSDGMFLLAALQLSALRSVTTIKSLRDAIDRLPRTLFGMYELTVSRIQSQDDEEQSLALRAILWVTHAARTLKVDELLHALSVNLTSTELDPEAMTSESTLVSVCFGLLTIETQNETVRLIHYTTHDFFISKNTTIFSQPHTMLAEACIVYINISGAELLNADFNWQPPVFGACWPFGDYAHRYLGHHTSRSVSEYHGRISDSLRHTISQRHTILLLYVKTSLRRGHAYFDFGSLTHFAALHGLLSLLIDAPTFYPQQSRFGWTPLGYAAMGGCTQTVKLLLGTNKIGVNVPNNEGETPLIIASQMGHVEVVQTLLTYDNHCHKPTHVEGHPAQSPPMAEEPTGIDINYRDLWGMTALLHASEKGHEPIVKLLLDSPAIEVNFQDNDGETALVAASEAGHVRVVRLLLSSFAIDANHGSRRGTALTRASHHGHEEVVRILIGSPLIDGNIKNKWGWTALMIAYEHGHEPVVRLLLGSPHIDVNAQDYDGWTALMLASEYGNDPVVELLLDSPQINANIKNNYGWTALILASQNGHKHVVQRLLGSPHTNPNIGDKYGSTALMLASERGRQEVVQLLLDAPRTEVDQEGKDGWTALMYACRNNHEGVVQILLDSKRIEINKAGPYSWTALMFASMHGHKGVVKLLLAASKIAVNARSRNGSTALTIAAERGQAGVVQRLLKHPHVDVAAVYNGGRTALHFACQRGRRKVVQLLLGHPRTDVNARDCHGRTPLHLAAKSGHESVVRLLLNHPHVDVMARTTACEDCPAPYSLTARDITLQSGCSNKREILVLLEAVAIKRAGANLHCSATLQSKRPKPS